MKSKKKRSKKMSRAEALARQLIKLYRCQVKIYHHHPHSDFIDTFFHIKDGSILIKPSSSCIYWNDVLFPNSQVLMFRTWEEVLFGSQGFMSLTNAIKHNALLDFNKASKNRVKLLLDFNTLDELDILLTLAGCNSVSACSRK